MYYLPQVGQTFVLALEGFCSADAVAPAALNLGRPKPTIEISTPALFFL
jgi:hypothetical protein